MLLNRTTLELAKLASKEENRYTLSCIAIEKDCAVVTDGHIMMIAAHPTQVDPDSFPQTDGLEHATIGEEPTLVSRDAALAALKAIPKKGNIPILQNAAMGTDGKLYVNLLDSVQAFKHTVTGKYLSWKAVQPNGEPIAEIAFNAKLMKQLCDYFIAVGNDREPAVRLTIYGKESAARLDSIADSGQELTGLLMPLRLESSSYAERPDQRRKWEAEESARMAKAEADVPELAADADAESVESNQAE